MSEVTTKAGMPGTVTAARMVMYLQGAAIGLFGLALVAFNGTFARRVQTMTEGVRRRPPGGAFVVFGLVLLAFAVLMFVFATQLRRLRTRVGATVLECILLAPTVLGLLFRGRLAGGARGIAFPALAVAVLVLLYVKPSNDAF